MLKERIAQRQALTAYQRERYRLEQAKIMRDNALRVGMMQTLSIRLAQMTKKGV